MLRRDPDLSFGYLPTLTGNPSSFFLLFAGMFWNNDRDFFLGGTDRGDNRGFRS